MISASVTHLFSYTNSDIAVPSADVAAQSTEAFPQQVFRLT